MKTTRATVPNAAYTAEWNITVIDDGQFMFPVRSSELRDWKAINGPITAANYEQFCAEVDYLGAELGAPGSPQLLKLCLALGAPIEEVEDAQ